MTDTDHLAECIVDYCDVDTIMTGTSGDEYEATVVRSVSQRVVRKAPAPVLTVGPGVEG